MQTHAAQLSFDFAILCPTPERQPTPIADALISAGLAPNEFILRLNRGISTSDVPAPSRLYRHPVEYFEPERDGAEGIYLLHPDLAAMPFVKMLSEVIGRPIEFRECDEYDRPIAHLASWWHAVDLMTEEYWRHLLDTKNLTKQRDLLNATSYALEYGHLKPETARTVLLELGCEEPADRSQAKLVGDGINPYLIEINSDTGKALKNPKDWALNIGRFEASAWMIIHALEDGWFHRPRRGYLSLTDKAVTARAQAATQTNEKPNA